MKHVFNKTVLGIFALCATTACNQNNNDSLANSLPPCPERALVNSLPPCPERALANSLPPCIENSLPPCPEKALANSLPPCPEKAIANSLPPSLDNEALLTTTHNKTFRVVSHTNHLKNIDTAFTRIS